MRMMKCDCCGALEPARNGAIESKQVVVVAEGTTTYYDVCSACEPRVALELRSAMARARGDAASLDAVALKLEHDRLDEELHNARADLDMAREQIRMQANTEAQLRAKLAALEPS